MSLILKSNFKKFSTVLLTVAITQAVTTMLFQRIQEVQAESNLKRVESIFQNESIASNPYLVVNELLEMKSRSLIDCISLRQELPQRQNFVVENQNNCSNSWINLESKEVTSKLIAANGSRWAIEFNSLNPLGFLHMLWMARGLLFISVLFFFFALEQREKRVLERQMLELEHQKSIARIAREVAHDIRSPLSALKLVMAAKEPTEQHRGLAMTAVNRIDKIAEDLLDRTREIEPLSTGQLDSCLDEVFRELKARYPQVNFIRRVSLFDGKRKIPIDSKLIKRIFTNLLQNSIEAADVAPEIALQVTTNETELSVQIDDNGKGFPKNYSLETSKSIGKVNGNGLGLTQVIRVLSEVKGKIEVVNLNPIGARVKIQIPLKS